MHMAVAKVASIAQTIEKLNENGVWTYAAEADGQDFYDTDFSGGCAIVLGGEDSGVSRLVRERCDYTVSIPMYGKLNSLNVSTAASVLLCHAASNAAHTAAIMNAYRSENARLSHEI